MKKPLLLTVVIFKKKPDDAVWRALGEARFERDILPENPYLTWPSDAPAAP
jgi:hypothetical protein